MPRVCSVCSHSEREAIDRAILEGVPIRTTGKRFRLTHQSLMRHRNGHLRRSLTRAMVRREADARPASPTREAEMEDRLLQFDICRRESRLAVLNDMHGRLVRVVEERAAAGDPSVPGEGTGLLAFGRVDTALARAVRACQEQAARELGQLESGGGVAGYGSATVVIVPLPIVPVAPGSLMPEVGKPPVVIDVPAHLAGLLPGRNNAEGD